MPKKEIDYSKTCIYRIICKNPTITECYIGHTTDLTKRKSNHKHSCNTPVSKKYNYNVYKFIRENGGWNNFQMLKIMDFPCANIHEASKQERLCLEEHNATLNSQIPSQTQQEYKKKYREENKEAIAEYKHAWGEKKKIEVAEYNKKYYEENKNKNIEL